MTKAHPVCVVSGISFFAPEASIHHKRVHRIQKCFFVLNTDKNETLFALHLGPFTLILIKHTQKKKYALALGMFHEVPSGCIVTKYTKICSFFPLW